MHDNKNNTSFTLVLIAAAMAQFLVPFMTTSIGAILPPIGKDLGASAHQLAMINSTYILGLAIFQLAAGRMSDIWGRRTIFLYGTAIFILSNVIIGFLHNINLILIMRVVQGAGAAMTIATGLVIISTLSPPGMRGKFIGILGAAAYAGMACGAPIAGLIASYFSWRWLFWINALCCIFIFLTMRYAIKTEWTEDADEPFDYKGCFVYALGILGITLGGNYITDSTILGISLLMAGVIILFFYIWIELKSPFPLLDVRMLINNKLYGLSVLTAFINYSSIFGVLFYFSIYLQLVRGMDVAHAGFFLAIQALVQTIASPLAGRLSDKYSATYISSIGIFICACGLFATAFLNISTPFWYIIATQALLGVGVGLFSVPNTTVILESVGNKHIAQAAGLSGAARTLGAMANMLIITVSMGFFLGQAPLSPQTIPVLMLCFQINMVIFGVLNLIAFVFAFLRFSLKKSESLD